MTLQTGPFSVKIIQRFHHRHGVFQETFLTLQNDLRTHILHLWYFHGLPWLSYRSIEHTALWLPTKWFHIDGYQLYVCKSICCFPIFPYFLKLWLAVGSSKIIYIKKIPERNNSQILAHGLFQVIWPHPTSSHPTPQSTWIAQCIHTVYAASLSHGVAALIFRSTSFFSPLHAYIQCFFS